MEIGFILPDGSYLQSIGVRDEAHANEILASYPAGTIRVSIKPSADHHWIDGEWVYVEPTYTEADLISYAAQKRWEKETGGLTVAGQTVATDRESQGLINGAYNYVQATPTSTIWFKASGGWVELDAATMSAIAIAVAAHVQACFVLERQVSEAITSGAITTFAEIDDAFNMGMAE